MKLLKAGPIRRTATLSTITALMSTMVLAVVMTVGAAPKSNAAAGANTLYSGETLLPGQSIESSAGFLVMQTDGNLVEYDWWGQAIWATDKNYPGNWLAMQTDGNLVVYNSSGGAVWGSGTGWAGPGRLVIQDDGNLVIYTNAGQPVWATDRMIYNRTAAVSYADTYCGAGNCPQSNNVNYQYFNGDDCTNFITQALIAGYWREIGQPGDNVTDSNLWWDYTFVQEYAGYYPLAQNSNSASVASYLYNFVLYAYPVNYGVYENIYGTGGISAPYVPPGISPGDLYFYSWHSDGNIDHAAFGVGNGSDYYSSTYPNTGLVDQHTNARYHIDWQLFEFNTNWQTTTIYTVHMYNYDAGIV